MPNKIIPEDTYDVICAVFKSRDNRQIRGTVDALKEKGLLNGIAEPNGYSLLMTAAACKSLLAAQLLVAAGADPNYQNKHYTALTLAIAQDAIEIVEFLINEVKMRPSSYDKEITAQFIKEREISNSTKMQQLIFGPSTQSELVQDIRRGLWGSATGGPSRG